MKNKNILVVVSLILVFITIYIIRDTYGLFESKYKYKYSKMECIN